MTGLGVARHDTELAVKSITVAVLSRKGKVGVWHSTAQNWQVIRSRWLYSVGQQIRGVACNGTELARNSLTVAVLSRRGKVVVWHAMAQIWQQDRQGFGVACHDTELANMQKFPLGMKERYHSRDRVTALSVYLAPTSALRGKCIEIAYWTILGAAQVILQQPDIASLNTARLSGLGIIQVYLHTEGWNHTFSISTVTTLQNNIQDILLKRYCLINGISGILSVELTMRYCPDNIDTMGQLWTPSLVSRTSPRRSELVVVHPSAEIFPEAYDLVVKLCACAGSDHSKMASTRTLAV
ncbi:hypothetical protein LSAT2_023536 [Lamellibrachia satsuma]|nr:hypothetical protein LSAT2_023536 [Lamellibrachia satsuma]